MSKLCENISKRVFQLKMIERYIDDIAEIRKLEVLFVTWKLNLCSFDQFFVGFNKFHRFMLNGTFCDH